MRIDLDTIITLENGECYMVLSKTQYENNVYYLFMGVNDNKEIIEDNVGIYEEELEVDATYVRKVVDTDKIVVLTQLLKAQS